MESDIDTNREASIATTHSWQADCKDCQAEARGKARKAVEGFSYSDEWAVRTRERGGSRSDRCERHRRLHREQICALSVPYIDLDTIGTVDDRWNPTGPLGGLGPLPVEHVRQTAEVNLSDFDMGLTDGHVLELLNALHETPDKRVAIVEAGTGTGKSTLLPFRLMNPPPGSPHKLTQHGPIVVTEPRKAAATGLAAFVGESMCFGCNNRTCQKHIGPGFPVGYQVSGDKYWDSACQLIYVTDGTMINWIRDGKLATVGAVIIDEAHERSENIDIILAQLRAQLKLYPHLRVIVTSATMDSTFFVEYFGGETAVFFQSIKAKKSFGYGVPLFVPLRQNLWVRSGSGSWPSV